MMSLHWLAALTSTTCTERTSVCGPKCQAQRTCRERRAAAYDDDDEEACWAPVQEGAPAEGEDAQGVLGASAAPLQQGSKGKHHDAGRHASKGREARGKGKAQGGGGRADREVDVQNRMQPICYAPLVMVPVIYAGEAHGKSTRQSLQAPPEHEPSGFGACSGGESLHEGMVAATRMPVCNPEEVGEVEGAGAVLGMPKRPAWQGTVSTAQQLHDLEERAFERWRQVTAAGALCMCAHALVCARMLACLCVIGACRRLSWMHVCGCVSSMLLYVCTCLVHLAQKSISTEHLHWACVRTCMPQQPCVLLQCVLHSPHSPRLLLPALLQELAQEWGDASFYEPRLDFWRELWRALEFSDVVLHVVDARQATWLRAPCGGCKASDLAACCVRCVLHQGSQGQE